MDTDEHRFLEGFRTAVILYLPKSFTFFGQSLHPGAGLRERCVKARAGILVGRITPCAPQTPICSPTPAHGGTRPTLNLCYSRRRASTGTIYPARIAGKSPKTTTNVPAPVQ